MNSRQIYKSSYEKAYKNAFEEACQEGRREVRIETLITLFSRGGTEEWAKEMLGCSDEDIRMAKEQMQKD